MTASEDVSSAEAALRTILDALEAEGAITELAHIRIRRYLAPLASAAAGAAAGFDVSQQQSAERIERLRARESDDKPESGAGQGGRDVSTRDAVAGALLDTPADMERGKVRRLEDKR